LNLELLIDIAHIYKANVKLLVDTEFTTSLIQTLKK